MDPKLGQAVTFLQDLIEKGLRCDMHPTRGWKQDDPNPRLNEQQWWQGYMQMAEITLKAGAVKCLQDMGEWTATNEKMYGHLATINTGAIYPEYIENVIPPQDAEEKIKLQLLKYAVLDLIQKLEADKNTSLETIKTLMEQL